ncbi:putative transcription factor/ chromatin remodeling BED-type(Zn) family [Helianthus annuus]|nr:putative transcription factor/ chromatin remodeling BED-type(Zn) family [Helianthus annuus]
MSSVNESRGGSGISNVDSIGLSDKESVDELKDTANGQGSDDAHQDAPKRKNSSEVWDPFVAVEVEYKGEKVTKQQCIHCKKSYSYAPGGPTSTLKRHLDNICPHMQLLRSRGKKRGFSFVAGTENQSSFNMNMGYEHMKCREIIAKMIIAHELPFSFVEYHWFNLLMKYNNPLYQKVSRSKITRDCVRVVDVEREKVRKILKNVDMISVTRDCWTSNQTIGYMCLTAHYIDSDWKLQKRIIGFNELAPPHSGEVISDAILECLIKWGIQDKVGTITLDNASNNDRAAAILRNNFQGKGKLHFEGLFFHVRCCAHILNLVVQDGLGTIDSCLLKVREGVKYLRKSPGRLLKFGEIAITLGISTSRSLCTDVKTRWNSTHRMLKSAIHYKRAFQGYALRDSNFEWSPTDEEWTRAERVCNVLEVFLDATNLFSDDNFLKAMSVPMYEKFEKYWGEIGVLMSIASILDPRLKMLSVKWTFGRLYPSHELESRVGDVTGKLKFLFEKYANAFVEASASTTSSTTTSTDHRARPEDDFFAYLEARPIEEAEKSELEVYLKEPSYVGPKNMEFDVLKWWNQNSSKFLILSKMARDIFCIPITTVASESAFSAGGRILDDYRSSLSKDMVEILVCGSDWIKALTNTTILTLEQSAKEEENLEIKIPLNDFATNMKD